MSISAERLDQLGVERRAAVTAERRATAKLKDAVRAVHESGGYTDVEIAALARVSRHTVLDWTGRRTRTRGGSV